MIETEEYIERVYSGVLGKIIGVYMGRPVEGWPYERIIREIGEIWYYIHDKVGVPLIVTDDDISGTFTFIRAAEDIEPGRMPVGADMANNWLNYIIEGRTILWWGGKGVSTEHTAYLALKEGCVPPESGSFLRNGKTIAEQIGAQIFIDAWAMLSPGNPKQAASFAEVAARTSHDGEAVNGAVMLAVMESLAFVEKDIRLIMEKALTFIPADSEIHKMNSYILSMREREDDWKRAWEEFRSRYNYSIYQGVCPIIPNHGLLMLSLLYGEDDFQKTQMIVNTCGWDTDCNAANAGCFMGIKNSLEGLDSGADFRTPVRDRLFLPTADGGRSINDALSTAYRVVNAARKLNDFSPISPKGGSRFHFSLPGSVQGFHSEIPGGDAPLPAIDNCVDPDDSSLRVLRCQFRNLSRGQQVRLKTDTFIPPDARDMPGYEFIASPTLYSGETVNARFRIKECSGYQEAALFVQVNGDDDNLLTRHSKKIGVIPDEWQELCFTVPETGGQPVVFVGIEIISPNGGSNGVLYLDRLGWDQKVKAELLPETKPEGKIWIRSWVSSMDKTEPYWSPGIRLSRNPDRGLFYQGTEEWKNYRVSAKLKPHLFKSGGVIAAVRGLRRYISVELSDERTLSLIWFKDNERRVLASVPCSFEWEVPCDLSLSCEEGRISAVFDGEAPLEAEIPAAEARGAAGLVLESGSMSCIYLGVEPLE